MKLFSDIDKNVKYIKDNFKDCQDIVMRWFNVGNRSDVRIFMIYADNIVSGDSIKDFIMTNLMNRTEVDGNESLETLRMINNNSIAIGEMKELTQFQEVFDAVLLGDTVLLMDGSNIALEASTKSFPSRGVSKAETEIVVQGPKDAFTELLSTNIVLIRRRIRDTNLKVKRKKIGTKSKTDVALMYMDDIVRKDILKEVEESLDKIDIDAIYDSGYTEQLIEKKSFSPFPQIQVTERPDKAAAAIFEGRVVVVVDNSPFVLTLPTTLNLFMQSAEDYYERWEIMSLIRFIRYVASFIAIALPGLYIALTVYHPSMIPTTLALKIAETRQNIPFPTVAEVLMMEIAFELLREAGTRLPSPVSSTLGIVGGIIIGQAAVDAGIVSPIIVIISALTGICTFVIPNVSLVSALRLVKYIVIFMSAILGLLGFWLAIILILIHLAGLESFGIPYLYPFCSASVNGYSDLKDSIFRFPLLSMRKRPIFSNEENRIKAGNKRGKK